MAQILMSQILRGTGLVSILLPLLAIGIWQTGEGLWIYAKAKVAQLLLKQAWSRAMAGEQSPKPWSWADTWPVVRLKNHRLGIDLIVLADAGGHALAFGPAHVAGSSIPGEKGTTVLTGHRDTHFSCVRKLTSGDFLSMDMPDGRRLRYIVRDAAVIDGRTGAIASDDIPRLALVTCYPFHTVTPGGPLRFVVMSDLDPATRPQ
jgi:sortase A